MCSVQVIPPQNWVSAFFIPSSPERGVSKTAKDVRAKQPADIHNFFSSVVFPYLTFLICNYPANAETSQIIYSAQTASSVWISITPAMISNLP